MFLSGKLSELYLIRGYLWL